MEGVNRPVRILASIFLLFGAKNRTKIIQIFLILVIYTVAVVAKQILKPVETTKGFIVASVVFTSDNLPLVMTWCCLVLTNQKKKCFDNYSNKMRVLDEKFESLGFPVNHTCTAKLARHLVVFVVFKIGMQQVPFFARGFSWSGTDFLDYVIRNVPLMVLHTFLSQWIMHLSILRNHFHTFNTILRIMQHRQNWMTRDFKPRKSTYQRNVLRFCGTFYDTLWSQTEKINEIFGRQIVSVIPTIFIMIIYNSFQTFRMIKKLISFDSCWIIFDLLYFEILFELVVPCVLVQGEYQKLLDILVQVNDETDVKSSVSNRKSEFSHITGLILQSYYQKIQFSACGVFPLDGTLIYTVFGALTTYLVILLQFDL